MKFARLRSAEEVRAANRGEEKRELFDEGILFCERCFLHAVNFSAVICNAATGLLLCKYCGIKGRARTEGQVLSNRKAMVVILRAKDCPPACDTCRMCESSCDSDHQWSGEGKLLCERCYI